MGKANYSELVRKLTNIEDQHNKPPLGKTCDELVANIHVEKCSNNESEKFNLNTENLLKDEIVNSRESVDNRLIHQNEPPLGNKSLSESLVNSSNQQIEHPLGKVDCDTVIREISSDSPDEPPLGKFRIDEI